MSTAPNKRKNQKQEKKNFRNSEKYSIFAKLFMCNNNSKKILKEKKYKVFDTDELSRDVISNSQIVLMYLEQLIGSHIIENGKLNFKTVGLFFEKNPSLENEFETWYQKFLGNKIIEIIAQLNESSIYFFDIPFLDKKGISNYWK